MAYLGGLGNPQALPFLPLSGGTMTGNLTLADAGKVIFGTRGNINATADGLFVLTNNAESGFTRLCLGSATSGPALKYGSASVLAVRTGSDAAYAELQAGDIGAYSGSTVKMYTVLGSALLSMGSDMHIAWANAAGANQTKDVGLNRNAAGVLAVTNGSSGNGDLRMGISALTAGTFTATNTALSRKVVHRFDWTNAMITALGASLTGDITICTLPAKTVITNCYMVVTGTAADTAGLSGSCGVLNTLYTDHILASNLQVAANTVYGDIAGERGSNATGFHMPSFTGTTAFIMHLISTTQNLSSVTGSTGSIYLETITLP
jgi:hypothetical protein